MEPKERVLKFLEQGKISADEVAELLEALSISCDWDKRLLEHESADSYIPEPPSPPILTISAAKHAHLRKMVGVTS